jgi:hypothetical protein
MELQREIKSWQETYQSKHGKKPTLEDMRKDADMAPMLTTLDAKQKELKSAVTPKFRV